MTLPRVAKAIYPHPTQTGLFDEQGQCCSTRCGGCILPEVPDHRTAADAIPFIKQKLQAFLKHAQP